MKKLVLETTAPFQGLPELVVSGINKGYNLGDDVKKIRAKILFVPAKSDLIFPPELSQRAQHRRHMGRLVLHAERQVAHGRRISLACSGNCPLYTLALNR